MQAVILAAGRGTRMKKLTAEMPKVLLEVAGKTLLEHKFDVLPESVDEVVIVVGYLGSKIQERFGGAYAGRRILYVEQEEFDGTAGALWKAAPLLRGRFIVMNGDDLYAKEDVEKCLRESDGWTMLVCRTSGTTSGARVRLGDGNLVRDIVESGPEGNSGLVNTALYVLDTRVFSYKPVPKHPGSGELGLPQTLLTAVSDVPLHAVEASFWIPITDENDLKRAENELKSR